MANHVVDRCHKTRATALATALGVWLAPRADFSNGSCHGGSSGSQSKRGSVRMWHMDMISDCQSVARLRWTARTICVQNGCKPSASQTLERELSEAIELFWLQAQKKAGALIH